MLKVECRLLNKQLLCMLDFGQIGLHLYSYEEWHERHTIEEWT